MATKKTTALTIKKPKLAAKPSEGIRQALEDLKQVEKNPAYRVDMDTYHAKVYGNTDDLKCEVCFAGAVMAMAGNDPGLDICPSMFDEKTSNKLQALDSFRSGFIASGLQQWGVKKIPMVFRNYNDEETAIDITPYNEDKRAFKKELAEIANNLEALGL